MDIHILNIHKKAYSAENVLSHNCEKHKCCSCCGHKPKNIDMKEEEGPMFSISPEDQEIET